MYAVKSPELMNETFVRAFNSRDIENLMQLYEPESILVDHAGEAKGLAAIRAKLKTLLEVPGWIEGQNNFCLPHGDLALLRADWRMIGPDGQAMFGGSSAEIVRRQADGRWLYVVDHASGASAPSVI